ncbi:addiction module RelB/DinJ family antitoxin [Oikeobacillus pervagus]|uniref:Addiction module RelB/DinJ family antitoxin n=1 Tax=Oikeobacillus pervagus TaxID=1325931 RepID=A0AAJ1WID8_9BACI|nr:type II toxin-antitoxin system RelB/DinJ family antitoxin [Oikeobacillus pervagus]MDQ0214530.1 addiction module RelB/DinJ family antitoxin [Oikeobacillus pervagus]
MEAKTANILARVEPEIKEKAEAIMAQLGVPASVVINMLYKQIIMTKSIPFSLSVPTAPIALDEMDAAQFDSVMQAGLEDAKANRSRPVADVFADLRREL